MTEDSNTEVVEQTTYVDVPKDDLIRYLKTPTQVAEYWPGMTLSDTSGSTSLSYNLPPNTGTLPAIFDINVGTVKKDSRPIIKLTISGELDGWAKWILESSQQGTNVTLVASFTGVNYMPERPVGFTWDGKGPLDALNNSLQTILSEVCDSLKRQCEQISPPADMVKGVMVPRVNYPVPAKSHPSYSDVYPLVVEWALKQGLINEDPVPPELQTVMQCASYLHPSASFEEILLFSKWVTWAFVYDDMVDSASGKSFHPIDVKNIQQPLIDVINQRGRDQSYPAAAKALRDTLNEFDDLLPHEFFSEFINHHHVFFCSQQWEAQNLIHNHIPDLDDFGHLRCYTAATGIIIDGVMLQSGIDIPKEVRESDLYQDLLDSAEKSIAWANDLYSVYKELEDGAIHNLVVVIRNERNCSFEEAMSISCEMVNDTIQLFEEQRQELLNEFGEVDSLQTHLRHFSEAIAGNVKWSIETVRYVESR